MDEQISVMIDEEIYDVRIDRAAAGYSVWQNGEEVTFQILFAHMPLICEAVRRFLGWMVA